MKRHKRSRLGFDMRKTYMRLTRDKGCLLRLQSNAEHTNRKYRHTQKNKNTCQKVGYTDATTNPTPKIMMIQLFKQKIISRIPTGLPALLWPGKDE